jgi:anti-sigma factor RsiW
MERNAQHAFDAEEVMAYLDGELEARRAAALAAHLVSCSECQEVAQGFRALSERMLGFEVEHPSVEMNETVLAALDTGKSSSVSSAKDVQVHNGWMWRGWFSHPRVWAIAGAAIVIALVVIGIPGRHGLPAPASHALREESGGYKSWLDKAGTATTRSGTNVYQTSTEIGGKDAIVAGAAPEPPPPPPDGEQLKAPESVGPMIVQTASLNILATNYDQASAAIEKLAAAHGGYVEKLDAKAQTGNARELSAALRIPTKQLDGFLADVRKLGHVEEETRSNEEVSDQYVDLQARLKSARATEQRLIELLGTRTGKLQDVLEAERELARIRGEIESMQGQSALLVHRVNYATVQVNLNEEYRQVLGSGTVSTGTKIRNAAVEGFTNLEEGAVALVVFVFAVGPSLLFWLAILLVPGWFVWKRFRVRARG